MANKVVALERALPTWRVNRIGAFFAQPVNLIFVVLAGVLAFLTLYPSFFLLYGSFTDAPLGVPGHFTLSNYIHAYTDPESYRLLLTSFIFGIGASGVSIILALVLAWITIRSNAPLRRPRISRLDHDAEAI